MNVTGVSTFVGLTTFRSDIHIVGNQAIDINNNALLLRGNNGGNGFITNSIGHLYISSLNDVENLCTNNFSVKTNTSEQAILATKNGSVAIYHDGGNKKLETTTNGIDVTGAITVNGSATSAWTISNNGSSNYIISGPGGLSSANNPDLYLERGQTYQFIMNAAGHGFGIQTSSGTWNSSNAYTTGITNAGEATGVITFQVPYSAPERLYYACTSGHSGMVGNIYIRGASGNTGTTLQRQFKYLINTGQLTKGGTIGELNTDLRIPFTPKFADSNLLMEFDTSYVSPNTTNLYYCLFYDVTNSAGVSAVPDESV